MMQNPDEWLCNRCKIMSMVIQGNYFLPLAKLLTHKEKLKDILSIRYQLEIEYIFFNILMGENKLGAVLGVLGSGLVIQHCCANAEYHLHKIQVTPSNLLH